MNQNRSSNRILLISLAIGAATAATAVIVLASVPETRQAFQNRPLAYVGAASCILLPSLLIGGGITLVKKARKPIVRISSLFASICVSLLIHAFLAVNLIAPSVMMRTPAPHDSIWEAETVHSFHPFSLEEPNQTLRGIEREGSGVTMLMFGGSGTDYSRFFGKMLKDDAFLELRILMLDYPGIGESEGISSESSLLRSGLKLYDYAKEQYPSDPIVLMGYSLGTGVATYVSANREADGLILVAPYFEATDFYTEHGSALYHLCKSLSLQQFPVYEWAESSDSYPLMVCSFTDKVTPIEGASRLLQCFENGGELVAHEDCAHGDYWEQEATYEWILEYLKDRDLID